MVDSTRQDTTPPRRQPLRVAALVAGGYLILIALVFAWEFPRFPLARTSSASLVGIFSMLGTLPSLVLIMASERALGMRLAMETRLVLSAAVQTLGLFLFVWLHATLVARRSR